MKPSKKIIVIFVMLTLINCTTNNPSNNSIDNVHEVYTINVDEDGSFINWDQISKLEKIIPLETHPNSIMGILSKGFVNKDKIFLQDIKNSTLITFDNNGKFLYKVGERGKGPGKYLEVRDFMVVGDNIYALDYKKIHCYDILNGKYKSFIEFKTNEMNPMNFIVFNSDDYYLWQSNPRLSGPKDIKYRLLKIVGGKIKEKYFKYDFSALDGNRFSKGLNESYNMRPINNDYKIYKLTKDSITTSFELDFKNYSLPKDYFFKNRPNKEEYFKSEYYKNINNIFETKEYIYFSCIGPNASGYEGLINKRTKQIRFGKQDFKCNPQIFYSDDDYFFGYYEPNMIFEEPSKKSKNYFLSTLKSDLRNLKIDDNLIIVKFSIKAN